MSDVPESLRADDGHLSNEHLAVIHRQNSARGRQRRVLGALSTNRRRASILATADFAAAQISPAKSRRPSVRNQFRSFMGFRYVTSGSVAMEIGRYNCTTVTQSWRFVLYDARDDDDDEPKSACVVRCNARPDTVVARRTRQQYAPSQ